MPSARSLVLKKAEARAIKRFEKIAVMAGSFIERMLWMTGLHPMKKVGYARGVIDVVANIEGESAIELTEMIANDTSYRFSEAASLARKILDEDRT